ncbi:MAG: ABC transporter ATP-binding protein [Candidatus Omnitrophica bacterium]|nr:ABC transporter ATP-binding protein [Candidatus Omnitrophota bacterium]
MDAILRLRNVKTQIADRIPPVRAVDGVDLEIAPGQMLALIGESGCGKTILALSIGRLLPPSARVTAGEILFEGDDLLELEEDQLRRIRGKKISYIFQDPMSSLNPVMSIGEQLEEAIRLHQPELDKTARRRTALALLEQVRINVPESRLRQYPHQLSGGMRQRIMIAMALAGKPALLIADEPTTALDVTTQAEIMRILKELQRTRRMAVLLITHDLAGVAPIADRIAVMYAGRIVETAPAAQLYQNPSHPYTQALLGCVPRVGGGKQLLKPIPGTVPDLRQIPPGCPFHPRCPESITRCSQEEPVLKPDDGRRVSCWVRAP